MPAPENSTPPDRTPYPEVDSIASEDSAPDLRRTFHALLEKGWLIGVALVVCLALAVAYIRQAPVLYASTATIQVEQQEQRVVKIESVKSEDLQGLEALQTIAQSIKSRSLMERVGVTNKLATDKNFITTTNAAATGSQVLNTLDRIVQVKVRRGTRLIDLTVTHRVPELTATIANSLVQEYMSSSVQRHVNSTEVANEFLANEAQRLLKKLKESEAALQDYREKSGATSLDERQNTVVAQLKELSTKTTEARSARIKAESDYAQAAKLESNVTALLTLPSVANDQTVLAATMSLTKAENEFAAVRQRYKEKHPKYVQTVSQVSQSRLDLTNAVMNAAQTLQAVVASAKAAEQAQEQSKREQETAALELSKLAIQYGQLQREVESDRTLYESVLTRMKETTVTKEVQPNRIRIMQAAYVPEKPVSPKKNLILSAAGLAGVMLGMFLVLGLNAMDSSIKTVDDAEAMLRLPVLGTVPQMKEVKKSSLVASDHPRSTGAEAFRTLRTSLAMLGGVEDRRVFLFTSAVPQEGKTFCSVNCSISLAQLGLRTLLIDVDLRRPSVEKTLFGKETEHPGVTDYLVGQKTFKELPQPTPVENLFYLPAGTTAPNPAELLAKNGVAGLLREALQHFDRIVLDSAPIHAVSDTLLMAKNVQTVCLVVRAARTPRRAVTRSIQALRGAGAPLSGVVLNRMPRRRSLGYGYYYDPYYDYSYQGKYSKKGVYGEK